MGITGHRIKQSQKINNLIEELTKELEGINADLKGVKVSDPDLKNSFDESLQKIGKARGRPLYFPFIGSGSGRGCYVELEDGSVKLDLINGIGVNLFGHSHPRLVKAALRGALSDVINQGNLQPNVEYTRLAEKLIGLAGKNSRLKHVWITTCGSRANEKALRITRQKHTPAKMILAFEKAFAGRTTMMAQVTDNPLFKEGLPDYHEVLRLPFYDHKDPSSTEKTLRVMKEHVTKYENQISAFMFEIVQGEGGFRIGTREFFQPLFDFCKQKKIAIWADEIQTFSRTGNLFAFETMGLGEYIDLCTVAKTLQVAAVMYTEEYNPKPGLIAGTFSGTSVALETGYETLEMLTKDNYFGPQGKIAQINKKMIAMLTTLAQGSCKGYIEDVGGLGLMIAFTPFKGDKDKVEKLIKTLYKNGLICYTAGRDPYRIRFLVPAIISDAEIQVAQNIIEQSIKELA